MAALIKNSFVSIKLAQLTSFESKNSFELSLISKNEVSWANFNTKKIIFNC